MARTIHPLLKRSNSQIANVIRNSGTDDYRRHIPIATQANLAETFDRITQNPTYRNHFLSELVNKIAMQIVRDEPWRNPLDKFKQEQLTYGASIEEIQVGLIEAYSKNDAVDTTDSGIWKRKLPPIDVSYHTVNRQDVYKVTVPDQALRGAFLNEGGLARFASGLLNSATTSDQRDEYQVMLNLFAQYDDAGGFFRVHVPDITLDTSTEADAKYTLKSLRAWAGKLTFLSEHYNAAKMPVAAKADDLELFITPEANAAIDVDALAGAFNIDRAEFASRVTLVDRIPVPGAIAILTTRHFFVVADQVYTTDSIRNPADLSVNHFLHHYQVVSASRFVPAVLFTTGEGDTVLTDELITDDVSALTVTDANGDTVTEVERGYDYTVDGYGIVDGSDFRTPTILAVTGNTSDRTFVTQQGSLKIGYDERADDLTLTQVAIDTGDTNSVNLDVYGDTTIAWPNAEVLTDEDRDGLDEVTPKTPTVDGDSVVIPSTRGVQYRVTPQGGTIADAPARSRHDKPCTVSAVARAGFELTEYDGPWTFTA